MKACSDPPTKPPPRSVRPTSRKSPSPATANTAVSDALCSELCYAVAMHVLRECADDGIHTR